MVKGKHLYDSRKFEEMAAVFHPLDMVEGTRVDHLRVGAYRTKTVYAGDFVYVYAYPMIDRAARMEANANLEIYTRKKKRDKNLLVRYAKWNNARRVNEFEQLVHAAFQKGDLHISLTYDFHDFYARRMNEDGFMEREDAMRLLGNYLKRVRRLLKRNGCDLNEFWYVAVTVTKDRMPDAVKPWPKTHHHHLLVHGIPDSLRSEVEDLWPFGYCNADRMKSSDEGLAGVAGYVARQESSASGENGGKKSYTTSKNIPRPVVKTRDNHISRRRVAQLCADVRVAGREIFERLYPGYETVADAKVSVSEFTEGAYVRVKLRRKNGGEAFRGRRRMRL